MANDQDNFESKMAGVYPKAEGTGFKVDEASPTFPWVDIIGAVRPDTSNQNSPVMTTFRDDGGGRLIRGLSYGAGDKLELVFHIPHEHVLNSEIRYHVHWKHNDAVSISGNFVFSFTATNTKRDGAGTPVILQTVTVPTTSLTTHPTYDGYVTEVVLANSSPVSGEQLDTTLIEVDDWIEVSLTVDTLPTFGDAGGIFISTADLHAQSTGIGTKNHVAPFYD